ncbi:pentapeptide repeat-containing protein [Streptomyces sp. MMBL 11-3]|uniref:pentapeptide repeat-containing protein n=1 Tax=Streptomyces sp. MMBL 11-3 TaxID=3382639 RepID=UPI0039B547E5
MSFSKRSPKQLGRHTPNLWPVWLVAPLALLLTGALAYGLYQGADALLTAEATGRKPVDVQDVIKTTVTVLTLAGAVLAGLYAYRKQLLDEGASHRADATQLAERYTTAAEQLGHDQPAVRLAGVYAMARLAEDWPEQRQVCIDVLCAYLRMPYEPDTTAAGFRTGEREVRLTIIRTIRDHLEDPTTPTTWCGYDLDFTGATFDGGAFNGADFTGGIVRFDGARFSGGIVIFEATEFSGGTVTFDMAKFSGGIVAFQSTEFSGGTVTFKQARFSDGTVTFYEARFSGSTVHFDGARFSDGTVTFYGAGFSGGTVTFYEARFSGSTVHFDGARFSDGTVTFHEAGFSDGTVHFRDVIVSVGADIDWGPFPAIPVNDP